MIVVTGAAGFIGSCLVAKLNKEGFNNLLLVDDFSFEEKNKNLLNKNFTTKIDRSEFLNWFDNNSSEVEFIFHIGARTDTTESNIELLNQLNLHYTQKIWDICAKNSIGMVYASSAATYGLGEFGYSDEDDSIIEQLKPLKAYGDSKNDFDKWALKQTTSPAKWVGFKFFNVYGPNEFHKGRMASVIFHSFNQINQQGVVKLFRSHNPNYKDGCQLRDFVYVKDVVDVLFYAFRNSVNNGIYNLGSGKARTFLDLVNATFSAIGKEPKIEFIDTPIDIRDKYQYFTEAKMDKLVKSGYSKNFTSLEEGVQDYVTNYLSGKNYF